MLVAVDSLDSLMRSRVVAVLLGCTLPWLTACGPTEPAAPKPAAIETRKTIGKTTQNVLPLADALASGGVVAEMSITSGGLEAMSDAYRTSVGKLAQMAVEQRMQLHMAEHGSTPATYEAFMAVIIGKGQPDGLQLPMLPYYQEYAFDPESRKLLVVEFPAKKAQREAETTGAAGL
jgi:hypothetical protein